MALRAVSILCIQVILLQLVAQCQGRTCFVGSNYKFDIGADSGSLTSTTCPNDNDFCVKLQGQSSATSILVATSGSYTIGYCTSTACANDLTCSSEEPAEEIANLKTAVDSAANSIDSFQSTSCKLACCEGDDCNSDSVDALNAITCMTGLSYVFYTTGVMVNNLSPTSCDVSSGSTSCINAEQAVTLNYEGVAKTGLVLKGMCITRSMCSNSTCTDSVNSDDIADLDALRNVTEVVKVEPCTLSGCCSVDNCNNQTLTEQETTTISDTTATTANSSPRYEETSTSHANHSTDPRYEETSTSHANHSTDPRYEETSTSHASIVSSSSSMLIFAVVALFSCKSP